MSVVESARFSCEGCGKSYKWKPELAGKKTKCKCGHVIAIPQSVPVPEAAAEPSLDDLYALAESGGASAQAAAQATPQTCPSCRGPLSPGTVLCISCGYNLKTGAKAQAAPAAAPTRGIAPAGAGMHGGGSRGRDAAARGPTPIMDLYVPIALLVAGMALGIWRIMDSGDMGFGRATAFFGVWVLFECVMVFLGCLIGIKWMGISLGEPLKAFLKIGAVVVGPFGLAMAASWLAGSWVVGFLLAPVLYYALLTKFFDMDLGEVLLLSGVVYVIQYLSRMLLLMMVLNALFGSVPPIVAQLAGMAMFGPGMVDDERADPTIVQKSAAADDKLTDELLWKMTVEAKAFLVNPKNRYAGMKREEAGALADELYAKGATKVVANQCYGYSNAKAAQWTATLIVVHLPTDAGARKALFDKYNLTQPSRGYKPAKDIKQKYLRFWTAPKDDKNKPVDTIDDTPEPADADDAP